jgi:hypothetical protein
MSNVSEPTPAVTILNVVKALAGLAFWGFVVCLFVSSCSSTSSTKSTSTTTTSSRPDPTEFMSGDGLYEVGNTQDWGIWQSDGATGNCNWSIRLVSPYAPAEVLRDGAAGPGERPRVNIQPLPGHKFGDTLTFQTRGCGSWQLVG